MIMEEKMKRKKEYCYKAILNTEYILYIGYTGNLYHVFVTNESHTINYSIYGGYKNIGTASNRLLESARGYKANKVSFFYATKELILKNGAFGM